MQLQAQAENWQLASKTGGLQGNISVREYHLKFLCEGTLSKITGRGHLPVAAMAELLKSNTIDWSSLNQPLTAFPFLGNIC